MPEPPTLKSLINGHNVVDEITALYEEMREPLLRFAYFNNLGDKAAHEDLVQDVFIELFLLVSNGANVHNPKAWLYRAIQRRGIDRIRTAQSETRKLNSLAILTNETTRGIQQDLEWAEKLERAMSRLNVKERNVLMLRSRGFSYKDLADALDISFESVTVYISRALRKLKGPNQS